MQTRKWWEQQLLEVNQETSIAPPAKTLMMAVPTRTSSSCSSKASSVRTAPAICKITSSKNGLVSRTSYRRALTTITLPLITRWKSACLNNRGKPIRSFLVATPYRTRHHQLFKAVAWRRPVNYRDRSTMHRGYLMNSLHSRARYTREVEQAIQIYETSFMGCICRWLHGSIS